MKLTVLLMLFCLQLSAAMTGQNVSLTATNASLKEVLKEINEQTGYGFILPDELLMKAGLITIDIRNLPVEEALEMCLATLPLDYEIVNNTIRLIPREESITGTEIIQEQKTIKLTGVIRDVDGNPLQGVAVIVMGTTIGASTDETGKFVLDAPGDAKVLFISFLGMKSQEIVISGKTSFEIFLEEEATDIDEVQVIAYGTITKRLNISSISTVKGKDIDQRPVVNVIQALQGQVPGISITNSNPGVGSSLQILVRGVNSITSGTNPMIIVDGVIMNDIPGGLITDYYNGATAGGGANTYSRGNSPLNSINPNDIESIDILKDADATAIYGSRGTNGVVLITTKGARIGETKVTINASTGFQNSSGITKRMNTEQYLKMRQDAFATGNMTAVSVINPITPDNINAPDLTLWSQTAYTDYPKMELNNTAPLYNLDATITGGTKGINFITSASYRKVYDTYMFDPYQERYNGRLQLNHTSQNDKFKLHFSTIFGQEKQKFTNTNLSNITGSANANAPNFELYKDDGSLNFGVGQGYISGMYYNPMANETQENVSVTDNFSFTGVMSYSLLRGLDIKVQANLGRQSNNYESIYPSTAINVQNSVRQQAEASFTTNRYSSLNIEPMITYIASVSKLNISALAGTTFLDKETARTGITVTDPGSDDLLYSYSSGNPTTAGSGNSYYRFLSVFAKASLAWDQKYLANFTFRRDGSSRFGPNNKYANFGSVGFGWIITQEQVLKNNMSFLSFGKLRGSLGLTGNNNIDDYMYLGLLEAPSSSSYSYNGNAWLNPANYANPNIKWESTNKVDLGIELGFFENRIFITTTWYRTRSTDLLLYLPLPSQAGFTGYTGNFPGVVQNKGIELELTTRNLGPNSSVQWTTKFNITHNENILKEFPGLEESSYANSLRIGRAIPSSDPYDNVLEFPYHFTGVDPETGLPQFKDINGDGVINTSDYSNNIDAYFGSATPTVWGGMTNTITYKGFSLDIFAQFSNGIFTKWNFYDQNPVGSIMNPSVDVIDNYWMQPGDNKKYPRLYTGVPGTGTYINPITQTLPYSTFGLYKGYYIRLKNVQLSYTLPESLVSKLKLDNVLFYVSAENLAVYTPVKLYKDPEVFWSRSAGVQKTVITGIRVSF